MNDMNSLFYRVRRQPYYWLFFLYFIAALINGIAFTDRLDFLYISSDLSRNMAPVPRQFLYSSPINFIIGGLLHLTGNFGFYFIHLAEIIPMLFCVAYAVTKKFPKPEDQIRAITLISLLPLWLITFKWIGKTDCFTISGLFLCWALPASRWRILIVTVMVFAHREVGTLMGVFLFFLEEEKDYSLLLGVVFGNVMHFTYQYGVLDVPPQSRLELIVQDARTYFATFGSNPAIYIMGLFTWYWIPILTVKPTRREMAVFIVAFLLALPCSDFTRDFVLAALPAILFHLERAVASADLTRLPHLAFLTFMQFQLANNAPMHVADNIFVYWLRNLLGAAHKTQ